MHVDHDRAKVVFDTLIAHLQAGAFPYNDAKRPQDLVGEGLSVYNARQQANFWFFVCMYMRGPVDSNYATKKLFEIFNSKDNYDIFDPNSTRSHDAAQVVAVMESVNFTRLLRDVKKFWPFNAKRLAEEFDGDARNIFKGVTSFDEVEERCRYIPATKTRASKGFMGFQKKMSSMLTYFLRERELVELRNFPPPVDFHLMRVMLNTGVLTREEGYNDPTFRYETSSPSGYLAIERYLADTGVNPVVLGDALWLLSANLCEGSPRNKTARLFGTFNEDAIEEAALAKTKILKRHPGLFESEELPLHINPTSLRIGQTCGKCPVSRKCGSGVPSTEYYVFGRMRQINFVPQEQTNQPHV